MYGSPISTTRAMKNEKDEKVVVVFFFLAALRSQLTVIVLVSSVTSLLHFSKVFFLI